MQLRYVCENTSLAYWLHVVWSCDRANMNKMENAMGVAVGYVIDQSKTSLLPQSSKCSRRQASSHFAEGRRLDNKSGGAICD